MFNGRFGVLGRLWGIDADVCHRLIAADWSSMKLTRSTIQKERQAIVAKFMDLNESQSHAFWPVYGDLAIP